MKLFMAATAAVLAASQAFAGSYQTKCDTTTVPYQQSVNATPGQLVGGAVVGGVLGKIVTNQDAGAAAGAVLGGVVANEAGKGTVTRYRDVQRCHTVYVPSRIKNERVLRRDLRELRNGANVSRETTMDVQYTIGVAHDGQWGPVSQRAADQYLANLQPSPLQPAAPQPNGPTYSLMVNNVVITTSGDVGSMDQLKQNLRKAGVAAQIVVN